MKYAPLDDHTYPSYALRLELGEDIHDTIQDFCAGQDIVNASLEGIGSTDSPTLAHYSIQTKQFTDKHLEGIYEVTSMLGNVARVDGRPFAHIHVTVSDKDMRVLGGHLVKGECSATLEIILKSYPSTHAKLQNDEIGLKVWDFPDR
jgi:predicted DNA-binding protein with PD1-like motif